MHSFIVRLSLYTVGFPFFPVSLLLGLIGWPLLLVKLFSKGVILKSEFFLFLFAVYFFVSALWFDVGSVLEFGFYRYDGNFFISYSPIFALAFFSQKLQKNHLFFLVAIITVTYFVAYAIWLFLKVDFFGGEGAFSGFHVAKNAAGGILSVSFVLSFILLFSGGFTSKLINIILILAIFLLFVMLISTYSRGSIIGAVGGCICYFFYRKGFMVDFVLFFIFLGITVMSALYFYSSYDDYSDEKLTLYSFMHEGAGTKEANLMTRAAYLWPKSFSMFLSSPLYGCGTGSYNQFHGYEPSLKGGERPKSFLKYNPSNAHHSIFQFLSENGLVGVLLFLCFIFFLRRESFCFSDEFLLYGEVAYFCFLTVLFSSFTEHRITTPSSMLLCSILIGNMFSYSRFKI